MSAPTINASVVNRLEWPSLDLQSRRAALLRPVQQVSAATRDAVAGLLSDVRERGDAALREITARFDKVALESFEVDEEEFAAAEAAVPAQLKSAMREAAERIEAFHRAGTPSMSAVEGSGALPAGT